MNQAVAEAILTCACGDRGCGVCRKLLTETDVKVAAFEECAQIAERVAAEFKKMTMTHYAAALVAERIRGEMALLQEMA